MTILNSTASVVPMVIDASDRAERAYDIYSLLLKERIVFLGTGVNDQVANLIVAQLLYLDSQNSTQPINMYINSPGGSVYAGMAIYDAMQMVKAPVYTTAVGVTASMGTVLLSSGEKGHRYALPHATIHMHPAGGGAQGYTEDVRIAYHEQERMEKQLFHIVGRNSGHSWKEIEEEFRRDRFMNALEAQSFGLVDQILGDTEGVVSLLRPELRVHLQGANGQE
ncbi:MAG: ATP-dependent Clp protease proteolytic subunit [Lewinellaceae bacterium]|nr:ATP-dependent Clp protease proteolytic subunit [Phaeodactylibacter sp.]MCB9347253.1 ATP-dependent Clp protease proteolytic subunit [Lewinellaceae bacterium]